MWFDSLNGQDGLLQNVLRYLRIYPVKGLSPRAQNLKKGGAWGAVGPKSQKRAKAPGIKIKKWFFGFMILELGSSGGVSCKI